MIAPSIEKPLIMMLLGGMIEHSLRQKGDTKIMSLGKFLVAWATVAAVASKLDGKSLRQTGRARMRQKGGMEGDVEKGFVVCDRNGLYRGPESSGTRTGVSIPPVCPQGGRKVAIFHTHPGGVPDPSPEDINEVLRLKIPFLCIGQPETGVVKCHRVGRRARR